MALADVIAQTVDTGFIFELLVALAIGALIGLERERHRESRQVLAGIRTYPLAALAGVIFVQLASLFGAPYFVALGAAIFAGFSLLLFWVRHTMNLSGLTSPVAFFSTYLVGALVGLGLILEGVLAGVAVTVLLFTKAHLHRLAEVMTESEMSSALQFIVLAFVAFPLLADRTIDPWGVLNPKRIILIVAFVAAISFVSFLVMRTVGVRRGLAASGFLGGLVNSEAATASLAALAQREPAAVGPASVAVWLTNATMLVRNLIIVAFVDTSLAVMTGMVPALGVMFLILAVVALAARRSPTEHIDPPRLRSPFAIWPALQFAALFVFLQVVAFGISRIPSGGDLAVYLTALGGVLSSAAVVASMASLAAQGQLSTEIAIQVSVLACIVSVLVKVGVARFYSKGLASRIALPIAAAAAGGLVVLLVTGWL